MEQEKQTPGQRALELIRVLLPNWQPTTQDVLRWIRLAFAVGIVILGVLLILDVIGLLFGITFLKLLKVLALPITVGAAVPLLNWLQKKREQDVEDQRAQDGALQAYLDQLTQLLVTQRDHALTRLRVDEDVRQVIQARSEPLLRSLNPTRRWSLILFLSIMGLLTKDRPLVSLAWADLRGIDGRGAPLQGVDLNGASLSEADLSSANLRNATVTYATLSNATLSSANLRNADLRYADLSRADLSGADLSDANVRYTKLNYANLSEANLSRAYLRHANLSRADLSRSVLREADLSRADLSHANLSEADLSHADLRETNMSEAEVTDKQLSTGRFLEGATMPDGQTLKSEYNPDGPTFEEWLKSKGYREDGENSGPS